MYNFDSIFLPRVLRSVRYVSQLVYYLVFDIAMYFQILMIIISWFITPTKINDKINMKNWTMVYHLIFQVQVWNISIFTPNIYLLKLHFFKYVLAIFLRFV